MSSGSPGDQYLPASNLIVPFLRKNINNRQLNNKNSGNNVGEISKFYFAINKKRITFKIVTPK